MKEHRVKSKEIINGVLVGTMVTMGMIVYMFGVCAFIAPQIVSAQQTVPAEYSDPTSSKFRIVVCDGPDLTSQPKLLEEAKKANGGVYIPCNFQGVMLQIQHLINIMMILGVLASIFAFAWAGALYISGKPGNKQKAHEIFPKIFTGFIIMLSSWFIVYQILAWLTDNSAFKALLQ